MWKCSFVVIVCCSALFLTLVHCLSLMWRLEFVFCFTHTAKMMTNVCIDKLLNRPSQTYDTSDEQHKWPETIQKRHTMLNNSHRRTRNWQNDQKLIKNKCKLSANRLKTNTKKKWGGALFQSVLIMGPFSHNLPTLVALMFTSGFSKSWCNFSLCLHTTDSLSVPLAKNICRWGRTTWLWWCEII